MNQNTDNAYFQKRFLNLKIPYFKAILAIGIININLKIELNMENIVRAKIKPLFTFRPKYKNGGVI